MLFCSTHSQSPGCNTIEREKQVFLFLSTFSGILLQELTARGRRRSKRQDKSPLLGRVSGESHEHRALPPLPPGSRAGYHQGITDSPTDSAGEGRPLPPVTTMSASRKQPPGGSHAQHRPKAGDKKPQKTSSRLKSGHEDMQQHELVSHSPSGDSGLQSTSTAYKSAKQQITQCALGQHTEQAPGSASPTPRRRFSSGTKKRGSHPLAARVRSWPVNSKTANGSSGQSAEIYSTSSQSIDADHLYSAEEQADIQISAHVDSGSNDQPSSKDLLASSDSSSGVDSPSLHSGTEEDG